MRPGKGCARAARKRPRHLWRLRRAGGSKERRGPPALPGAGRPERPQKPLPSHCAGGSPGPASTRLWDSIMEGLVPTCASLGSRLPGVGPGECVCMCACVHVPTCTLASTLGPEVGKGTCRGGCAGLDSPCLGNNSTPSSLVGSIHTHMDSRKRRGLQASSWVGPGKPNLPLELRGMLLSHFSCVRLCVTP